MPAERSATLFEALRESGLLEPAQLEQLARLPEARDADPRALGRLLVQRGLLTRFQVNLLAQGRAKELFLGPYVLLERLGEGGMGQVYKARHKHMSRVVALKLIRKEKLASADAVKRFYQEVQAAARLQHPNIAIAYDAGQEGSAHFLSMEYVEGTDLARLVKEHGPLPAARACEYVRQAALGLQHAHERGMVHRDIKPHNLLLSRPAGGKGQDAVKILDFGLARLGGLGEERALTQTGAVIGTPDYLAPEQALNSRAADVRSDLYALGCTLYFLLAGRAPFHAEQLTELLLKHQMERPRPLGEVRPDVSAGLNAVVMRLLAKRPEERYQTPAELAEALEPFAKGGDAPPPEPAPAAPAEGGSDWATIVDGFDANAAKKPRSASHDGTLAGPKSGRLPKPRAGAKGPREEKKAPVLLLAGVGGGAALLLLVGAVVAVAFAMSGQPTAPTQLAGGPGTTGVEPTKPSTKPDTRPNPPVPPPNPPVPPPNPPDPNNPAPDAAKLREVGRITAPPGFPSKFRGVAFSRDGAHVIGATTGLHVWDARTQQPLRSTPLPQGLMLISIAPLPDGRAVTALNDKTFRLWDVEKGEELRRLAGFETPPFSLAVSADGKRVAGGSGLSEQKDGKTVYKDVAVHVWDAATGQELPKFEGHEGIVQKLALSRDGRRGMVKSVVDGVDRLVAWDVETGKEQRRLWQRVYNFAFLPDGRQAVLAFPDGRIVVWDLDAEREVRAFKAPPIDVTALAVSPGGRYVLAANRQADTRTGKIVVTDAAVRLYDVTTGELLKQLEGHTDFVGEVAFSPDGGRAVTAGNDDTCRLWELGVKDPEGAAAAPAPGGAGRVAALAPIKEPNKNAPAEFSHAGFLPAGGRVFATCGRYDGLWDAATGNYLSSFVNPDDLPVLHCAFFPDGKRVAVAYKKVSVVNAETGEGRRLATLPTTNATCLAVSADGKRVIAGTGEPTVADGKVVMKDGQVVWRDTLATVWDAETGQEVAKFDRHTSPVTFAALLDNGRRALTFSQEGKDWTCLLWDVETGKEIRRVAAGLPRSPHPRALAVTPDEKKAVFYCFEQGLVVWDLEADKQAARLPVEGPMIQCLAVSPGGRYLLTGHHEPEQKGVAGATYRPLRLWDLTAGKAVKTFELPRPAVQEVSFSPDGRLGLSVRFPDRQCEIWDLGVTDPGPRQPGAPELGPGPVAANRPAVPDDAKLAAAEKLLKELFKDEYARTKPADKQALATRLLDKAKATKDDPAARFVMLREARDLAAAAGDAQQALAAVAELDRGYAVNGPEMRLTALTATNKALATVAQARALVEGCFDAADAADDVDDYDTALKFLALAGEAARRAQAPALQARVANRDRELRDAQKDLEKVKASRDTLKDHPDDAEANLAVGRYLAYRKGDWDRALPHLAAAGQEKLTAQAKKDLAKPAGAAEQAEVGDGWFDLAQAEQGPTKLTYLRRAGYWYRQAVPSLPVLNADRVNKRLQQIDEADAAANPPEKGPAPVKLVAHNGAVNAVGFSPDGKLLVSGGDDHLGRVWDLATLKELLPLSSGRASPVTGVLIAGEKGNMVAVGGGDGWVHWWDLDVSKNFRQGGGGARRTAVVALAATPSGLMVEGTKDGTITWGNWKDGPIFRQTLASLPSLRSLGIAGEQRVIAGDEGGTAYLYAAGERGEVARFQAHKGAVTAAAVTPDGKRCVTAGEDKVVTVWDVTAGKATPLRQLKGAGAVTCAALLADGRRVLTGGEDKTVRLWDVASGRELMRFTGHSDKVNALALSPDGNRAASAGADKMVLLWDLSKAP